MTTGEEIFNRVLIIKPSSLGDVVTAIPLLRALRRKCPGAHISWLIAKSCVDMIAHDSDLSETILFDRKLLGPWWRSPAAAGELKKLLATLRNGKFDLVIDMQGLLRSGIFTAFTGSPVRAGFADARECASIFYNHAIRPRSLHTIDRNIELARSLGIDASPADLTLQIQPAASQCVDNLLSQQGLEKKKFIVCVPSTRWLSKVYPQRHWKTVVAELAKQMPVVLLGSPGDAELCETIKNSAIGNLKSQSIVNFAGKTSVSQMVAVIAAGGGVVCSDSAAKFIAPAVGVNVVCLIGPTKVNMTGPYIPRKELKAIPIVANVPCHGCLKRRCLHTSCMELINPQEAVDAAKKIFSFF